jgi:hypothetical protein
MTDLLGNDDTDLINVDPTKNYYAEYVGEGKKYKTNEDLAKSKAHADLTIDLYKRKMDELRADYLKEKEQNDTGTKLKELMDQLSAQSLASNQMNLPANEVPSTFDPKQLDSLVSSKIMEHETTRKQEDNFKFVQDKLIETYGPQYKEVLNKQMTDLGLSAEDINNMARKQPQVFVRTFGLEPRQKSDSFQSPLQSNLGFAPTTEQKRTWNWYQEMRKNNPTVYHNQKTQQQMISDYNRLGEAFEDGNFHQYN